MALSLSAFQCVSQQKQDKENRWAWVDLGVELLFHSVVFYVFFFLAVLILLDSDVDPEIVLVHLGHGGVFVRVCLSASVCV